MVSAYTVAIDATSARPKPTPSAVVRSSSRWNGSKRRVIASGGTGGPVLTTLSGRPGSVQVRSRTSPPGRL
jgi:hypothetical protein